MFEADGPNWTALTIIALILCSAWIVVTALKNCCKHTWQTEREMPLREKSAQGESTGRRVYLKCIHCGSWKKQDLIG